MAIIKKVTGLNVREYLIPRLFAPLDIIPGIWECAPQGINFGGWGLYLRTTDILKFANLILNQGNFNGKQLIPVDFLAAACKKHSDSSENENPDWKLGYGYQFWMSTYGFRGDGAGGQYAIIIPEKKLVIAITASMENMQDILTILWDEFVYNLEDQPLPENPSSHHKLLDTLANLSLTPAKGKFIKKKINCFFEFEDNCSGIYSCSLECGKNECALTFHTMKGVEQLRAGFGYFQESVIQLTDIISHPTVASAAWLNENVLKIQTFCLDGTFRDNYQIDLQNSKQPLFRISHCSRFRPEMSELILKSKTVLVNT